MRGGTFAAVDCELFGRNGNPSYQWYVNSSPTMMGHRLQGKCQTLIRRPHRSQARSTTRVKFHLIQAGVGNLCFGPRGARSTNNHAAIGWRGIVRGWYTRRSPVCSVLWRLEPLPINGINGSPIAIELGGTTAHL